MSTNQEQMLTDVREVNTSSLYEGQVIKNYPELCRLLKQPVYNGGVQKKNQLEDLRRFFEYEQSGRNFIITQIYKEPLTKEQRIAVNAKYVSFIQSILLSYLSTNDEEITYLTNHKLWEILGMVNEKYFAMMHDKEKLMNLDPDMSMLYINDFYRRSTKKFREITKSSLDSLKRRLLLVYDETYRISYKTKDGFTEYREATDDERRYILQKQREVLVELGMNNEAELIFSKNRDVYYDRLSDIYREEMGWDIVYSCYKIIYNKKNIIEAINTDEEIKKLNSIIIETLNEQAINIYNKKGITADNMWERTKQEKKPFFLYESYPTMQEKLSEQLIKLN